MSEGPEQIKKHIAALTDFETKYGVYIGALEEDWTASIVGGAVDAPEDLGSDMPAEEFTRLTREVRMLATRADQAIRASGVDPIDGSTGLPSLAFDFEVNDGYFSDDGMSIPRQILGRLPSQISGLEIKLEEAEVAEEEASMRLLGEVIEESRDRYRQTQERRGDRAVKSAQHNGEARERNRPWWENPWVVGVGVTVIGGLIVLVVWAVITA